MIEELEKLIKKFEGAMTELRADVQLIQSDVNDLRSDMNDGNKSASERADKIAQLTEMMDAKAAALAELKAYVCSIESDISDADPSYKGHFPNAKRARNFGLWVLAMAEMPDGLSERARLSLDKHNKALAENVTSTGGGLVPEEFVASLIKLQEEYGVFRRNARVVPMASDRQTWPKLDGHITVYYPGEAGTITETNPTFENVQLVARKACALTAISSELEEDAAVAIGEIVLADMARGFALAEDQASFLGDGTSTYWGFQGITGALLAVDSTIANIASLQVASGNAYSEIVLPDFDAIVGNYPNYADNANTKWYMHRYFYWTVVVPLIQAYSSNVPTIGNPSDTEGKRPFTFRGYPVELVDVMPSSEANSQICALLANLQMGAYLGDRRQMRFDRSREVYFTTDQIGLRATRRHAINVFGVGDTSDAGPIMGLITAAS